MLKPFNGPSPRSRGHPHTRSQPTWGCPGTEGTRDHRGLVAEQADELASAHLLCLCLFRLKWHRAASDNETNHCSLDSVLPGTAPTKENNQEQFWSLKKRELTWWNFTGTLCQSLKKSLLEGTRHSDWFISIAKQYSENLEAPFSLISPISSSIWLFLSFLKSLSSHHTCWRDASDLNSLLHSRQDQDRDVTPIVFVESSILCLKTLHLYHRLQR